MKLRGYFFILLFLTVSISLLSADTIITNFYNSTNDSIGTSTNCTFDQAESNICGFLRVPKNSTVINGTLNVSWGDFMTYTGNNWSTQDSAPSGITWAPPYFYEIGPFGSKIYQYYSNLTYTGNNWPTQDFDPTGITWASPYFYEIGAGGNKIYQYYSNLTYTGNNWPTQDSASSGITWASPYFYEIGDGSNKIYQYYSNLTYTGNNWPTQDSIPEGIAWDGTYFYEIGRLGDKIYQYYSNMTYTGNNWPTQDSNSKDITWASPYFYEIGAGGNKIYQYYNYPTTNLSLDIANNANTDWSMTGELNSSNSPKNITLNRTAIQNYVDNNAADANGYVYVPLNFTSDTAGIVQLDALSMYIDLPPYNFLFTRANNSNLSQTYFDVNVTYTDTGPDTCLLEVNQTVNYAMSGIGTTTCNYTVTGLSEGTYNYTVWANDTNGKNSSSGMFFVTLDRTAPSAIENQTTSATKGEAFTLNVDITDALTGIKNANGSFVGGLGTRNFTLDKGSGNTWSSNEDGIDSEGNYNLTIIAYDFAGNSNTTVELFSIPVGQVGGSSGGGGTPSLKWCSKESKFITRGGYTDERCLEEIFIELKAKNATIVYFGQKNIGLFPSKIMCQPFFGTKSGCRSIFILTNKTTYVLGGVYSVVGVVEQRDYTWSITGVGVDKTYSTPEFEVIFGTVGNYTLSLTITDSIGMVYTKSHDFEVLEVLADEAADNETDGGVIPGKPTIVGIVWGAVKTFGGKVKGVIPMLPKRIVDWGIENKWFLGTLSLVGIIGGGFVYSQKRGF